MRLLLTTLYRASIHMLHYPDSPAHQVNLEKLYVYIYIIQFCSISRNDFQTKKSSKSFLALSSWGQELVRPCKMELKGITCPKVHSWEHEASDKELFLDNENTSRLVLPTKAALAETLKHRNQWGLPGIHHQIPCHPREEAQGHDARNETPRYRICHTLHRRTVQLGSLHQVHDLAQHGFTAQLFLTVMEVTVINHTCVTHGWSMMWTKLGIASPTAWLCTSDQMVPYRKKVLQSSFGAWFNRRQRD